MRPGLVPILFGPRRQNLLLRSEEFDNASWVKFRASVVADAIAAPDGSVTADTFIPDTSNNTHILEQNPATARGTTYTVSIYAKAAGYSWLFIALGSTGVGAIGGAYFDLTNGVVGSKSAGIIVRSMPPADNGFYRCIVTGTTAATASGLTADLYVGSADAGSGASPANFAGDGTSGIYLWGAQANKGLVALRYKPTTTAQFYP